MNATQADRIARWVRSEVRGLCPYQVPDASGLVKLDAMENPYTWPQHLVAAWLEELRGVHVNRYPDPSAARLKTQLRETMEVPTGMEILLGNGSDELIQLIALTLHFPSRVVLAPEPTFVMYRITALAAGLGYVGVPLRTDNFDLDREAMLRAVKHHQPAVIFLAYPNNPTGNLYDYDMVGELIDAAPGLVVIDEAYTPFAGASFMQRLTDSPNLLVLRTLSKLGLAGLRLGLLIGRRDWLTELDKLRLPYNINVLTQVSARFALAHYHVLRAQTEQIKKDRDDLMQSLAALEGVNPWPSRGNFILFRVVPGRANAVFEGLREAGILIKNLHGSHPSLEDCLRVTVGTPEENRAFLDAITRLIAR